MTAAQVSQSAVNEEDLQWLNALDIVIPSVTISAHSKELLCNSEVNIVHGRRCLSATTAVCCRRIE